MTSETPAARARTLERQAREDPSSVPVAELFELLSEPSATVRRIALEGLQSAVTASSVDPAPVAARVRDQVTADDQLVRNAAVTVLARVAVRDPDLVVPMVDDLRRCLTDPSLDRPAALSVLETLSGERPAAVRPAVPELFACLEGGDESERQTAVFCLGSIALESPDALVEGVGAVVDLFAEPSSGVGISTFDMTNDLDAQRTRAAVTNTVKERRDRRAVAGEILREVARVDPDALAPHLDAIADQLDDDDPQVQAAVLDVFEGVATEQPAALDAYRSRMAGCLAASPIVRSSALGALGTLAATSDDTLADALDPHVDALAALLEAEDTTSRADALALLATVADDEPEAVAHVAERVRPLLGADEPSVRRNAVRLLGAVGDSAATATLVDLSESDPDAAVRAAARDATPRR